MTICKIGRVTQGLRAILAATLAFSTTAHAAPCDLSPLVLSKRPRGSFPLGTQSIQTETVVSLKFVESGSLVKITRTEDTFLLLIGEAFAAQVDELEKTLPKNDCNKYARVATRNARVTPPTFSISVLVEASAW